MSRPSRHHYLITNLVLLLRALHCTAHIGTSNAVANITGVEALPAGPDFNCTESHTFSHDTLSETRDCLQAVFQIPLYHQEGRFQAGPSGGGPFVLAPFRARTASCEITIEIAPGQAEVTTWQSIDQRVGKLMNVCSPGLWPAGRIGGETTAGVGKKIKIRIAKPAGEAALTSVDSPSDGHILNMTDVS